MRLIFFTILFVTIASIQAYSQDTLKYQLGKNVLYGLVIEGDTILMSSIDEVFIFPKRHFASRGEKRRYDRLVRNVKKVYPYAVMAREKFEEVNVKMGTLKSEKAKKRYLDQVEKEIKDQYEEELKKLTITQGRILIKLIDREVGETSYDVVKQLKGSFSAFLWQTLARLFGSNLKSEFDAEGEDKLINEIVIMIEKGAL
ncbi:MAG: DUF4294 domain-containing protein [Bacteroidales bacterium]|nr:DUF4294 domain-containing protein [Bacteroidales bacterium]